MFRPPFAKYNLAPIAGIPIVVSFWTGKVRSICGFSRTMEVVELLSIKNNWNVILRKCSCKITSHVALLLTVKPRAQTGTVQTGSTPQWNISNLKQRRIHIHTIQYWELENKKRHSQKEVERVCIYRYTEIMKTLNLHPNGRPVTKCEMKC